MKGNKNSKIFAFSVPFW